MPSKNEVKPYIEQGFYHLYNRGVEKRLIFQDNQDYGVFLSYLKAYLLPKDEKELRKKLVNPKTTPKEKEKIYPLFRLKNFAEEIVLLAFCLMPNHFHLLLQQISSYSIASFMNSILTRYTMYFNKKYKRVGPLYQGVYKGVLVETDVQLLELSRYIHRNPLELLQGQPLQIYNYSSYPDYFRIRNTKWINTEEILSFFSKTNPELTYHAFVQHTEDMEVIHKLIIED